MNIEKAIQILELHNKWRRDNDGKYEMAEPKELGKAIDLVVSEFKKLHLQNVSVSDSSDFELQRLFDWLQDPKREPAQTKFTAGMTRNVAREFEYLLKHSR
jgi:hypothetical protein